MDQAASTTAAEHGSSVMDWAKRIFGGFAAAGAGSLVSLFAFAKDLSPDLIQVLKDLGPLVVVVFMFLWIFAWFLKMQNDTTEKRFQQILDENREDRRVFRESIQGLQIEIRGVQTEISGLYEEVTGRRKRVATLPPVSTR